MGHFNGSEVDFEDENKPYNPVWCQCPDCDCPNELTSEEQQEGNVCDGCDFGNHPGILIVPTVLSS